VSRSSLLDDRGGNPSAVVADAQTEVATALESRDGRLWICVDQQLFVHAGARFDRVQRPDGGGVGIVQDRDGDVWVQCLLALTRQHCARRVGLRAGPSASRHR
jgi:hypothetical protein